MGHMDPKEQAARAAQVAGELARGRANAAAGKRSANSVGDQYGDPNVAANHAVVPEDSTPGRVDRNPYRKDGSNRLR